MIMALSGITAHVTPSDAQTPSPLPVDEQGNIEINDPKSMVEKQIIERLFSREKDEAGRPSIESADQSRASDAVEISSEAMALYRSSSEEAVIRMPDGATVTFSHEHMEFLRIEQTTQMQSSDPLVIDLNGNGIELTDVAAGKGVLFDLTGDGVSERVSWVAPDDGLLALDRNRNGLIDNGFELFGDQHGAIDGFSELSVFDGDQNGAIDKNDPLYSDLWVWQDKNQNGISESNELKRLGDLGIESISLHPTYGRDSIAGNPITGYTRYETASGRGTIGEAWLNYYA
jgi:hypothetical protein